MSRKSKVTTKTSIKLWHEWRAAIDVLREKYSWNELSKLHGHSERGWCASAYKHRGLLSEAMVGRGLTLAKRYIAVRDHHTNGKEQPMAAAQAKAYDIVSEFKATVTNIVDDYGISLISIGQHIGYNSAAGVSNIMNGHTRPSQTKLLRLRALAGKLADGFDPKKEHPLTDLPDGKPAPALKGRDVRDPRPAGGGAYAWMDSVSEGLLALAEEIGQAALEVPAAFRGPYTEKQNKIMELAAEFER